MAVYLVGFAVSLALVAIAEKKRRGPFFCISCAALLIPCLIAALRAETIGTDVLVYVKPLTESAIESGSIGEYFRDSWFSSWRYLYVADYEYGFSLLVYFVAKLTGSLGAVLFVIQALTVVPIYVAIARNRKTMPVWLGMLAYYFFFYNTTLNLMRQWIAMGFLLLAFQMLLEKKWGWLLTFFAVAFLFHYSSVIALLFYAVYLCLLLRKKTVFRHNNVQISFQMVLIALMVIVAALAVMNLDLVLSLMSAVGFDRFSNYLEGNPVSLLLSQIVLRLPLIALFVVNWRYVRQMKAAGFYLAVLVLDVVVSQLISVDMFASRISAYFFQYTMMALPVLYSSLKPGLRRNTTTAVAACYAMVYWYYTYVIQLRNETYPYAFF